MKAIEFTVQVSWSAMHEWYASTPSICIWFQFMLILFSRVMDSLNEMLHTSYTVNEEDDDWSTGVPFLYKSLKAGVICIKVHA